MRFRFLTAGSRNGEQIENSSFDYQKKINAQMNPARVVLPMGRTPLPRKEIKDAEAEEDGETEKDWEELPEDEKERRKWDWACYDSQDLRNLYSKYDLQKKSPDCSATANTQQGSE